MDFISTRGNNDKLTASQAIIRGISGDGGLYVPTHFPNLSNKLKNLVGKTYSQVAFEILKEYLTDFNDSEIKNCIHKAYDNKFEYENAVDLKKINDSYFLELYHGPTLAFKDMALTIMPHLLKTSIEKIGLNKEVVILTATSGDTGKAALEGFKDVENIKIIVFFPEDGVSAIQKLQMKTQKGENTHVVGIKGNFDDAQTGVKNLFSDENFVEDISKNGYVFSSANSINIGRLLPQIVYYFYSYINLISKGEIKLYDKINFVVPTGNFGNILAGYYAKKMGLPINKLICASNENNVLYEFFNTGEYNKNKILKLTSSPSMDILISSNLERLLFEICNRDQDTVKNYMSELNSKGFYRINSIMKNNLDSFDSEFSSEDEVSQTIKNIFVNFNYLIDTHTAVAYNSYEKYVQKTSDNTKTVIVSTANPYKFSEDVLKALKHDASNLSEFEIVNKLQKVTNAKIPDSILSLKDAEILHRSISDKDNLKYEIKKFLKV